MFANKGRYDRLYQKVIKSIEEGSLFNESCHIAYHALEDTIKQCVSINQSLKIDKVKIGKKILLEKPLLDPSVSKIKGAPKRIKSGIQKSRNRIEWKGEKLCFSFYQILYNIIILM